MPVIHGDQWLSEQLQRPVFLVEIGERAAGAPPDIRAVREHIRREQSALYFVKVPTADVSAVEEFSRAGFFTVDVNVTLQASGAQSAPEDPASDVSVEPARPEHESAIAAIAAAAFDYSRFHLDPLIERRLADELKREWVVSCLRGRRGVGVLVALIDGTPAGFLTVVAGQHQGRTTRVIDLIGVRRESRRRGVGKTLVRHFLRRFRPEAEALQVGTQVANIPSLQLYGDLGFRVVASTYVMHCHVGAES